MFPFDFPARYERKYKVEHLPLEAVLQAVRLHPASFRPLYSPRWVNNLYFDTPDLTAFQDSAAGAPERRKYRLRWYGRPFEILPEPVLEIKSKQGEVGIKQSIPLAGAPYALKQPERLLEAARQPLWQGKALQPVLFNSYHRSYWAAAAGRFRLTIDTQLQFGAYQPSAPVLLPVHSPGIIIELKYAAEEEGSDFILQQLPFRQTKSSKYMLGVNLLY
jgi:hypothetical protein